MRLRGNRARIAFFAGALLFALVALLPLRLAIGWFALDGRGLAARDVAGSLWLGVLGDAQFGGVALGDMEAGLRFLPLFVGRARIDVERADDGPPLEAGITATRHGFGIDDATGTILLGGAGGLPIEAVELDDVSVRFAGGLCEHAEGRVRAQLLGELAPLVPGGLAGEARCDGAALLLRLRGQAGADGIDLRLLENGRWRAQPVGRGAGAYPGTLEGEF